MNIEIVNKKEIKKMIVKEVESFSKDVYRDLNKIIVKINDLDRLIKLSMGKGK
jgi:hypothetical protein